MALSNQRVKNSYSHDDSRTKYQQNDPGKIPIGILSVGIHSAHDDDDGGDDDDDDE